MEILVLLDLKGHKETLDHQATQVERVQLDLAVQLDLQVLLVGRELLVVQVSNEDIIPEDTIL